jgi:hypothetical protein
MQDRTHTESERPRQFVYRATLPPALALLLVAPLLFLFLSFAAVALAGGSLAALFLPLLFRNRKRPPVQDEECVTLSREQYSRVDPDARRLPPP